MRNKNFLLKNTTHILVRQSNSLPHDCEPGTLTTDPCNFTDAYIKNAFGCVHASVSVHVFEFTQYGSTVKSSIVVKRLLLSIASLRFKNLLFKYHWQCIYVCIYVSIYVCIRLYIHFFNFIFISSLFSLCFSKNKIKYIETRDMSK